MCMQYATHYTQVDTKVNEPILTRSVCVDLKHVQSSHFLHLCFLLDVTYVTYFSSQGALGKLNFCPVTDKSLSHSGPRYSQPNPGNFCISTPQPTLYLYK